MVCLVSLSILLTSCGRAIDRASITGGSQQPAGSSAQQLSQPESGSPAGPVDPDPRVGAVFIDGRADHVCTGSVVHSTTGDLVLTAAHCLPRGSTATFVPGFTGDAATQATWTVDTIYLDARWITGKDPRGDYAIARVSKAGGGSVEAQAGSALSLGTAPAPGSRVTVTGYPAGVGGRPVRCQGSTGLTDGGFPSLPCEGLVDGTSGAPWMSGSAVTGVIGGLEAGGCTPNVSYSAPFDERTAQLLARAEARGPGDTPPAHFDNSC
ncbi:MAG: trypsin-like peptidase domain-containing protein [Mycobacterium sp.]